MEGKVISQHTMVVQLYDEFLGGAPGPVRSAALALRSIRGQTRHMSFQIIAQVENPAIARVLVVALRAHGFHPLEPGEGGLPGVPNLFGRQGIPVQVPEAEVADATVLADELLREMNSRAP